MLRSGESIIAASMESNHERKESVGDGYAVAA